MNWQDVIRRPVITEKSMLVADLYSQYSFVIHNKANKIQVRKAVEMLWPNVTVEKVCIINVPAKRTRRLRRNMLRKLSWKKAIVKVSSGDVIDVYEGI